MLNMQALMKQAQTMQKKMEETQAQLKLEETTGTAGGGMVEVVLSGAFDMKKISIKKELLDPQEVEVLEDLIMAAFNDAKKKVDDKMSSSMGQLTNGLNLGGMKLPF